MNFTVVGRWLAAAGLVVLLGAALMPVSGTRVLGTDRSIDCGPAAKALLGMSEFRGDNPIMYPGSDVGIGRQAWCSMEAERRLVPLGVAGLGLLGLGAAGVLIGGRASVGRAGSDADDLQH